MHPRGNCHSGNHQFLSTHQIEIAITPGTGTVSFKDERYVNPVDTLLQFTATVYNAPTNRVVWLVFDVNGNPAKGTINETGLYTAPAAPKTGLPPFSITEIVVAYPEDDPSRRATAFITVTGNGPEKDPDAVIEIFPKRVTLYYRNNTYHNEYIDQSNKAQLFRAVIKNSSVTAVNWSISPNKGSIDSNGLYLAETDNGSYQSVKVTAQLSGVSPVVKDEAVILLVNYKWDGITT